MWPYMFSELADEYDRRYGLEHRHLHAIAELNMRNAKAQPAGANPRLDVRPGQLRRRRHRQPGRRGTPAAHRLQPGHRRHRRRAPGFRPLPRQATRNHGPHRRLGPRHRRALPAGQVRPQPRPALRLPARQAGRRRRLPPSAISESTKLDGIETHDCFSMSEYMAVDHFGITGPGQSWKAVENGDLGTGRRDPGQPQRRPHRRRAPGGRQRSAHAPRRGPPGHRPGGGDPGREAPNVRHPEHRRQPDHHRQLRRNPGGLIMVDVEVYGKMLSTLPPATTIPTGQVRGGRSTSSTTRTTCTSPASCPTICTASTCATPRTRCTRPSSGTTPSTATG